MEQELYFHAIGNKNAGDAQQNARGGCIYGRNSKTRMIRKTFISVLLLITVGIMAAIGHLFLHREAWVAHGEDLALWDWTYVLMEGPIPFAVAQYVAVAGAFALAWVLWSSKWRLIRNILIMWGITWLPVAIISTGDVTASSGGPFNFPMSMFAAPLFAFFCLVELGAALRFRAFRSTRGKVNPTAERRKNQNMSTPEHD